MRFTLVAIALVLAGCAGSPYNSIGTETADQSYRTLVLTAQSSGGWRSPTTISLFIKAFESNGKLGLCGYYTTSGSSSAYTDLVGNMLASNDSQLQIGGEVVGSLRFLRWNPSQRDAVANCVEARAAWDPSYSVGQIGIYAPGARGNG
jgi:hypothetical protein